MLKCVIQTCVCVPMCASFVRHDDTHNTYTHIHTHALSPSHTHLFSRMISRMQTFGYTMVGYVQGAHGILGEVKVRLECVSKHMILTVLGSGFVAHGFTACGLRCRGLVSLQRRWAS